MTEGPRATEGSRYDVNSGDVSGQLVVGSHNVVTRQEEQRGVSAPVSDAQLAELRSAFARVRSGIADLGDEGRGAGERLDELEEAVTSAEPDVSVMVYVRNWFLRTLPSLAGAVLGLIVDPVVGQLVHQAGDEWAAEYDRQFGADGAARAR